MSIIGIDPGKGGGIVVRHNLAYPLAFKMPATDKDLFDLLSAMKADSLEGMARAFIEKVHAQPGQGVTSMFNFGQNYGALRMALTALGIPFREVAPGTWQRPFNLPTLKKAGGTTKKKNAHKARAQELFPGVKVTHAVADALLIAEWGRRQR